MWGRGRSFTGSDMLHEGLLIVGPVAMWRPL
jgi:hypothetical protein